MQDSVLIITSNSTLRKGISISLLPFFSSIYVPSTREKAFKLIESEKINCLVSDFDSYCQNDLELHKVLSEHPSKVKKFVLAFSLDSRGETIVSENNIETVVNSINEIINKIDKG